jgi:hypothetical protein
MASRAVDAAAGTKPRNHEKHDLNWLHTRAAFVERAFVVSCFRDRGCFARPGICKMPNVSHAGTLGKQKNADAEIAGVGSWGEDAVENQR